MKIKRVKRIVTFEVETDESEYSLYSRSEYGAWYVYMGDSLEYVHDYEGLEELYQKWTQENDIE